MIWLFLILLSSGFAYEEIILDPKDPRYSWMDEIVEQEFSSIGPFTKHDLEEATKIHRNSFAGLIKHLKVVNNQVTGPEGAGRSMLEKLCQCYGLPDLEMFYFQMDGLCETPWGPVPIFTGARKKGVKNTIYFVDWYYGDPGRPRLDKFIDEIDQKLQKTPWFSRKNMAVWRGAICDVPHGGLYTIDNWFKHPRARACWLSTQHPHLIDAAFYGDKHIFEPPLSVWIQQGHEKALSQVIPVSPHTTVESQLDYKYQLYLKGLNALFSRDWEFYSQSVVFCQEILFEMYWYPKFLPWKHYIPVADDLSDLIDKIHWATNHDPECLKIATQSREFIQTHAMPEHTLLFCYKALLRYASLFEKSSSGR